MADKAEIPGDAAQTPTMRAASGEPRLGYCQECGRPLTSATLRRVGAGVFCPPCSTQRQASPAWQAGGVGQQTGAANPPRGVPTSPVDANPAAAVCLGMIPGVGAMYNGQYAKGAMHLVVFVVLVALADNLNWVFYWLVWGWVFYQAFDAYHTARARRDGLPLPNPLGWNDFGDRLGMYHSAPPEPATESREPSSFGSAGANWMGYVPPREPAPPAYPAATDPAAPNPYTARYSDTAPRPAPPPYVPYAPTYTASRPGQMPAYPPPTLGAGRRFPIGAVWLIGLGIVFLLGNLQPAWRLSGRWLVPLLLAALALWGAGRRWAAVRAHAAVVGSSQSLAGALVGPVMLFTVAVLLAFQTGRVVTLHRSWPVLLVVWGAMLLLQRTSPPPAPMLRADSPEAVPQPVRSTSGTGSLGL